MRLAFVLLLLSALLKADLIPPGCPPCLDLVQEGDTNGIYWEMAYQSVAAQTAATAPFFTFFSVPVVEMDAQTSFNPPVYVQCAGDPKFPGPTPIPTPPIPAPPVACYFGSEASYDLKFSALAEVFILAIPFETNYPANGLTFSISDLVAAPEPSTTWLAVPALIALVLQHAMQHRASRNPQP